MSLTSHEIDEQAAEWAARQDLRELTPQEQAEFHAWLVADPRNLGAYGRADAVLARLERVSGAGFRGLRPEDSSKTTNWPRRRVVLAGSMAASIAFVFGVAMWQSGFQPDTATKAAYATSVGQTREVLLSDGSIITLNTNSSVSVEFTKATRKIRLVRGEALFDVAKNKQRPFVVSVGDTEVRAVGTSFTVSMLPRRPIQVLVREGIVEVKRADTSPVWVGASTRAVAAPDAPIVAQSITSNQLTRDLAWQYGRIALDNRTLQDAAEEFSRYSEVRIVVDPAVANRTVTGLFAANDPVGFAKAAASVLDLRVEVKNAEVRISGAPESKTVGKS